MFSFVEIGRGIPAFWPSGDAGSGDRLKGASDAPLTGVELTYRLNVCRPRLLDEKRYASPYGERKRRRIALPWMQQVIAIGTA
jgi:hypothetical protein